ncbi:LacI family transcriptional regulator [Rhodopirellula rubra]|uniref:LacI family transcriptional regulator n=1 Tax=Aporhodopirellula rubra TaxID=980271 RepID=A0A7W5E329_9BACT|nr:XylR family transcriptional regulator [Aporhodopirellula rubra]MBB3209208.1 LacI family transcriptional regulator [Aporhodopirellula rubra]
MAVERKRVALIVESSGSYGRDLLDGITQYCREANDWIVFYEQRDLSSDLPLWLMNWDGHGIITRITSPKLFEAAKRSGIVMVELTDRGSESGAITLRSDDEAIGRLGVDHFSERGFNNFAFCGFDDEAWSLRRERAFAERASELGSCAVYRSRWHGATKTPWEKEQAKLIEWIRSLPTPVGVMGCSDIRGQHVLQACVQAGLDTPEEVAVLGVDNDELVCQLSTPPLSSIITNARLIGYKAAEALAKMIKGEPPNLTRERFAPVGVCTRQSTDIVAIDDPDISMAITYIRENACAGISVDDVLKNVPVSRSTLERQMRKYLHRSPQQEIRKVRLSRACELLKMTDLSIERISAKAGFNNPEYMHAFFRRELKMTPGEFRDSVRS